LAVGDPAERLGRGFVQNDGGFDMISWAVTFLVIALIAAVLGFSGIAGTAVNLAWICAIIGIILALVFGVLGRRI
jgi:uncharacterized membrane protein YtjA (UPF0391 family)